MYYWFNNYVFFFYINTFLGVSDKFFVNFALPWLFINKKIFMIHRFSLWRKKFQVVCYDFFLSDVVLGY